MTNNSPTALLRHAPPVPVPKAPAQPTAFPAPGVKLRIPFNRPFVSGAELRYLKQAIDSEHLSGNGPFTRKCEAVLQKLLGAPRVLLTTSCTDALEMAALLLQLQQGDQVVIPSFTFVSTANAFVLHGARPVFADIRPDTLNVDDTALESLITPRTRAIVPVHYAGVGCELDTLALIASRRAVRLIEDNAHGLFGSYRGQPLGTFGSLATLSFHETKNLTCGEGGALVINDPTFLDRSQVIRDKGTDRSRFLRGEVDKYTWVDRGSSFLPSDLAAAFLYAQLEAREGIQRRRRRIWNRYWDGLRDWALRHETRLPVVPARCQQAFHMFYLILPSPEARQALIDHLKSRGILSVFHYTPLHLSRMGRHFGGRPGQCPVTEHVADRLLRLPFYTAMTEAEQAAVISALQEFDHWPAVLRSAGRSTTA